MTNTALIHTLTLRSAEDHWLQLESAFDAYLAVQEHYAAVEAGQPSDLYATQIMSRLTYRPLLDGAAWVASHPDHEALHAVTAALPQAHYVAVGSDLLGRSRIPWHVTLPGLSGTLTITGEERVQDDPPPGTPLIIGVAWGPDQPKSFVTPDITVTVAALPLADQELPTMEGALPDLTLCDPFTHLLPIVGRDESIPDALERHGVRLSWLAHTLGATVVAGRNRVEVLHPQTGGLTFSRVPVGELDGMEARPVGHSAATRTQLLLIRSTWAQRYEDGNSRYVEAELLWPVEE